jgi:hypothetical protein
MAPSITPCKYIKQAREGGERSGYKMVKKWLRSCYPTAGFEPHLEFIPQAPGP